MSLKRSTVTQKFNRTCITILKAPSRKAKTKRRVITTFYVTYSLTSCKCDCQCQFLSIKIFVYCRCYKLIKEIYVFVIYTNS